MGGAFTDTLGALTLAASGNINFGNNAGTLTFGDSSAINWTTGATRSVVGYTTGSHLFFGTNACGLTPTQLGEITIDGQAVAIGSGGELTAVPEPSTYAALAGLMALGFAAYRRRRA